MVRGPMIGAVTTGSRSSQASATSAGASPSSRQSPSYASSWLRWRSIALALAVRRAPALRELAEHAAEQPAAERAPRDHAEAVRAARRDHLELDGARGEVVQALLGDQAEEVARRRGAFACAMCQPAKLLLPT